MTDAPPPDLCPAAVKVARQLQQLPTGKEHGIMYALMLIKGPKGWELTVLNPPGGKVQMNVNKWTF